MAVDRTTAQAAGAELVRLFQALELELAHGVAQRLERGLDEQDWESKKLAAAGELRTWAQRIVHRTMTAANGRVAGAVARAFLAGGAALEKQLAAGGSRTAVATATKALPNQHTIGVLARALTLKMDAAGLQVVRSTVDVYRRTVADTAATVLGGATTRRDAAQRAYSKLINEGVTGFTDSRGRRWSLAGYIDMATRTTVAQAAVQGQLDRQADLGLDFVIVSNAPQECKLCRPWEGKVLTRDGSGAGGKTVQVEHAAMEFALVTVHVAGSVAEALAAGLMHPNCRHSLSAYLPGLTQVPTHTADPEGDAARQKLRALERATRDAKLRQAAALTPAAKKAAGARVRDLQSKIKDHVAKHDLTRRTDRERPNLGLDQTAAPAPTRAAAPKPSSSPPTPAPAAAPARPRYEGPIDSRMHPDEVATIRKALDRQAALVPSVMKKLKGVQRATAEDMRGMKPGAAAFYRIRQAQIFVPEGSLGERMHETGLRALDTGWWSKCPREDAGGGHILAHEFGHHVDHAGMSDWQDSASIAKLWDTAADEMGLPRPSKRPYGQVTHIDLPTWFEQHKRVIEREVSTYGAVDSGECLAEIWAEYSNMGEKARPLIRKIGAMMQQIAERSASK